MLINLELHNTFLTLFTLQYFVIFITIHICATDWRLRVNRCEAVTGLILYCPCLNNLFKYPIKLPYVTLFRFYVHRKWSWGPHVESVKIMLRQYWSSHSNIWDRSWISAGSVGLTVVLQYSTVPWRG